MELLMLKAGARSRRPKHFRYERKILGETAFVEYRYLENEVVLKNTFVPRALRKKGHGSKLVKKCIEHFVNRGHDIIPACQFIQHFIDENPQYHRHVTRWEV